MKHLSLGSGYDPASVCVAGAKFPAFYGVLQWPAQWPKAQLAVPDVKGRTRHKLLQKPIHAAGQCVRLLSMASLVK